MSAREVAETRRILDAHKERLEAVTAWMVDGLLTADVYRLVRDELCRGRDQLASDIAGLSDQPAAGEAASSFAGNLSSSLSPQQRRELAARAMVAERTIANHYAGRNVKPTVAARVATAAASLGYPMPPEGA